MNPELVHIRALFLNSYLEIGMQTFSVAMDLDLISKFDYISAQYK